MANLAPRQVGWQRLAFGLLAGSVRAVRSRLQLLDLAGHRCQVGLDLVGQQAWLARIEALRDTFGKTELRRSLRTKEADIAKHRALLLSTQLGAVMADPKFLSNPSIADFPHLLRPGAKDSIREKMRIDLERGIVETDTPEETERAAQIVADYAQAREVAAQAGISAVMPSSKCGALLEKAKDDYPKERQASLKDATWRCLSASKSLLAQKRHTN